ncbi:hypothetical protein BLA9940_00777 [Burkholderia aenigmatica]|uniref:Uncharacterized protein n=1 Tax=Burkholderia aenigmatica TaxID=2015348 RepID=A0ABY6Y0B6_9BURK|nr:hypothetical protein BLA9940_00777 [Burkholderia aenigmatica]VWC89459.1 hypothetical protein BLA17378_04463 [Burkholderia aenigmatica]VWC98221.1 hypothetical protein BLA18628_02326 [Burkholderia aenigmatica]
MNANGAGAPPESDESFANAACATNGLAPGRRAACQSFGKLTAGSQHRTDRA